MRRVFGGCCGLAQDEAHGAAKHAHAHMAYSEPDGSSHRVSAPSQLAHKYDPACMRASGLLDCLTLPDLFGFVTLYGLPGGCCEKLICNGLLREHGCTVGMFSDVGICFISSGLFC